MTRTFFVSLFVFWLGGCASPTRQSQDLLAAPGLESHHVLTDVAFVDQSVGQCGPATLTMAIQTVGGSANVEGLAPMVMGSSQGSLPSDMISAGRRLGFTVIQISNLAAMAREVQAGHPVVVLQNLGLSFWPRWHYALVVGFDRSRQEWILHSGHREFHRESFRQFERSWDLADQWASIVLRPGENSVSADELEHLRSASALEQLNLNEPASRAYLGMLKRWPTSLGAFVGLANIAYNRHDFQSSVRWLKRANAAHPNSLVVQHNLDIAERSLK